MWLTLYKTEPNELTEIKYAQSYLCPCLYGSCRFGGLSNQVRVKYKQLFQYFAYMCNQYQTLI